MSARVVRLPNGRRCGLGSYVASWKTIKALAPADMIVKGWDHFPTEASVILRDLRAGMHDRINRHDPAYEQGRKWAREWQVDARRTAQQVNTPRLAIHWLPAEFRARFAHRLSRFDS